VTPALASGPRRRTIAFMLSTLTLAVVLAAAPSALPEPTAETRISIDVKETSIVDIVRVLAEVGGFQVVMDPGLSCMLTLKLNEVPWPRVLDVSLRSCRLGYDEQSGILRIAPVARLAEEGVPAEAGGRAAAEPSAAHQPLSPVLRQGGADGADPQKVPLPARRGGRRRAHQHADHHRHRVRQPRPLERTPWPPGWTRGGAPEWLST